MRKSSLARSFLRILEQHLQAREVERRTARAVSTLGSGAAFESWLAFEARLALERRRAWLRTLARGQRSADLWTANEFMKIDLCVGRRDSQADGDLLMAVEFKIIANNKNWTAKVDGVWADLFPTRAAKANVTLEQGRLAVVGLVWKRYEDPSFARRYYPGQCNDLRSWQRDVWQRLVGTWRNKVVRRVAGPTRRFEFKDVPDLLRGESHFVEFHALRGQRRSL